MFYLQERKNHLYIQGDLSSRKNFVKIIYIYKFHLQVIAGPAGRKLNAVNPFQNLTIEKLTEELAAREIIRGVLDTKKSKKELEKHLKQHLSGAIRPPALSFGNVMTSMEELNLSKYEISPIEPLRDIKGHIKNVWTVLPEVLPENIKKIFSGALDTCYGQKDKVRGCDYRLSTIIVYNQLKYKCSTETSQLLYTLQEICRLTYLKAIYRTPKYILRLFNVTFQHAMLCFSVFGKTPKLTSLYGIYFHAIVTHLPEMARIIAPSSLHSENEERTFSSLNSISLSTSSRTCDSIRDNGIIRMQAEKKFKEENQMVKISCIDSKISKFSGALGL